MLVSLDSPLYDLVLHLCVLRALFNSVGNLIIIITYIYIYTYIYVVQVQLNGFQKSAQL